MFRVTIRGHEVTCESTEEIVALVLAAPALIDAVEPTRPTTTRPTTGKKTKAKVTAAQKKARAKKARAAYKAKQDAKAAAATPTTAETHHGEKPKQGRADTSGEVIAALRRSGLALTIPEIRDDLQKAGWKYSGPDPKGTIRATLNRLVGKGTIARGTNNGDITFRIARVEHDDPLPHQQRETDV